MIIELEPPITIKQLADSMDKPEEEIKNALRSIGKYYSDKGQLRIEQAIWIVEKEGFRFKLRVKGKEDVLSIEPEPKLRLQKRPPVVTVMGHVDHGKTLLLDAIRHTNLAAQEPGAITQHIGAYKVHLPDGDIVFLDTPGHEAFIAMRARGATVTDIVVLVVAADEGVKAQTIEAVNHAKAANVPIIVAVNKIDKPESNPLYIREQLAKYELIPEEWQGETIYVDISARYKKNLDRLLEMILLQAEIMELKADPSRLARGTVLESKLDPGLGPTATVLVQDGSLRLKDPFVCGQTLGRVRFMIDEFGKQVKAAPPSTPVRISFFSDLPKAGDPFFSLSEEKEAKRLAELIAGQSQKTGTAYGLRKEPIDFKELQQRIKEGQIPSLPIVLKVDVFGSLQPIAQSLENLKIKGARIDLIHSGVGTINESDILFASVSQGIVIGFNVKPESKASSLAQLEGVEIRLYNLIYELIDEVAGIAQGLIIPQFREQIVGKGVIIRVFHVPDIGAVAGCLIHEGKFLKGYQVRIIRKGIVIFTGEIVSLKHYDQFVDEIGAGYTCGIIFNRQFSRFRVKDQIEVFVREEIPQ